MDNSKVINFPVISKNNSYFYQGVCVHNIENRILRLINIVKVMVNNKESRFHALIEDATNDFFLFETFDNIDMEIGKHYMFKAEPGSESFFVKEVVFN